MCMSFKRAPGEEAAGGGVVGKHVTGVGPRAVSMHFTALSPGAIARAGLGRHNTACFIWVYSTRRFGRHQ